MRSLLLLATVSTLAACSGGGPTTVGGNAPPQGPGGVPGQGGHSFVNPTEKKTYSAIGGVHSYKYFTQDNGTTTQGGQLYAGDASTARNSGITISYDPRDAIFQIEVAAPNALVAQSFRFQDPVHRTDFGGAAGPQEGTPELNAAGVQYLEAGGSAGTLVYDLAQSNTFPVGNDGASRSVGTFFYQKPGTETRYVTFAGFVRNATTVAVTDDGNGGTFLRQNHVLERGAFAYGERSANSVVPRTGTGTFTGPMAASMVYNPQLDADAGTPTYFQWMDGRATTIVDFAANSFTLGLTGTVMAPQFDIFTSRDFVLQAGAAFNASGDGGIDLVNAGGFVGQFSEAFFTQPGGARLDVNIAGSSIDGAFFGPAAEEVGGGFRIVGGTPDERIDILGAFTGAR